jgi:hydroxymethylglutaryl-CoA synthase
LPGENEEGSKKIFRENGKEEIDMVGIRSYGAYVPFYRLSRDEIARGWGSRSLGGEKAVANYDEDSITMAVAATLDCLPGIDREAVDGLFFATTTSPYGEKQGASVIATAADLPREIKTADFCNSLRSGTNALASAMDAINAGAANNVIVTAADCRQGAPGGESEQLFGDGAAAIALSHSEIIASMEGSYSFVNEFIDNWRGNDDIFVRSWEPRFIIEGYMATMREAVSGILRKYKMAPKDINKVVFYAPDPRTHSGLARDLGFDPRSQVQDPLHMNVGNTGSASALMMLVAALETAKAKDKILFVSYGDGADAFIFQVTDQITKLGERKGVKGHLGRKRMLPSYQSYVRFRNLMEMEIPSLPQPISPSPIAMWRERKKNLALYGVKCKQCGTVQYPPQRICINCQAKDQFEDYRFSDKRGKLFSFGPNYLLSRYPDTPEIYSYINVDGGGRLFLTMTDRDPAEVKIGLPMEFTFRRLYKGRDIGRGISNYFWKCKPAG